MRRNIKQKIFDIIKTINDAHNQISRLLKKQDIETAKNLIGDCQNAIIYIGETIGSSEGEDIITLKLIEEYCKNSFDIYNSLSNNYDYRQAIKTLNKDLTEIKKSIRNDIAQKTEIVFLPYKSSMWDSLESVWKAADEDPMCNVYVIPIPYYDRNPDHSFGTFHYEGNDFPSYVPITDYRKYDFHKKRPDIIYIHYPYDDCNSITSVEPFFYSHNLKYYTDMLIYIPYFIDGFYNNIESSRAMLSTSASANVDYIIVQSEAQRNLYENIGVNSNRLLVYGNPKTDAILVHKQDYVLPEDWQDKIYDKKVILINSTIASFLSLDNYIEKYTQLIEELLNTSEYVVIWRPHPLLEATIKSMRPNKWEQFIEMKNYFVSFPNFILDNTKDALMSIQCSDLLISDYSSIVFSYLITGKPVISIVGDDPFKSSHIYVFDYRKNYFYNIIEKNSGISELVNYVFEKNDPLKNDRIELLKKSIVNYDGTCGLKVHEKIKTLFEELT